MNMKSKAVHVLLALAGLAACAGAVAQASAPASAAAAAPAPAVTGQGTEYTAKGADTCLGCHDDESATYSAEAIFKSKHAHRGDKRAPIGAGGLQCEACHGPGAAHAKNKKAASINSLRADPSRTTEQRNAPCLGCHEGAARIGWHAGAHERAGLACTDCHQMHQQRDRVLTKSTEADVCFTCHKKQRADFQKPSAHPIRQGLMGCSDCHSAHGSSSQAMLVKATLNQTCFSCHADKRGPVLWEHAPVAEDCSLCHTAHGSARPALLTKSPPLLCQQCHSPSDHPSVARTSSSLPGGSAGGSIFLVAGGCTNCHSQVHGSNHPAGAKLMR
ncbi:MAG: DmsE family decaheme c-type cytochrome [Caldimonas sp.]